MPDLKLSQSNLQNWWKDDGDRTLLLNYDLNENSVVLDLGGYLGIWAEQIIQRFNPNMYIIEPVPSFYNAMSDKFLHNSKVRLLNIGIGTCASKRFIYINDDSTSSNISNANEQKIEAEFYDINVILEKFGLSSVDLLQMNIEGDEYDVLEHMISSGGVDKIENMHIQFHLGIDDDIQRRFNIQDALHKRGFKKNWEYPFVWESWSKIK